MRCATNNRALTSWHVTNTPLTRTLGTSDAVIIGLGSMIGAGIFVSFGPAAALTGGGLLFVALVIAALVAFCNATSTARLAALYPASGGTYVYGTRQLGPFPGYLAGWAFVTGKTASCATMALTIAHYLLPQRFEGWVPLVAILAVVAITGLNLFGIQKSALVTRVIVASVVGALGVLVIACVGPWSTYATMPATFVDLEPHAWGVFQAASILFFAFAGYARIATLGEEVRDPARTIPRAVPLALGITFMVYALVAWASLEALGAEGLAASTQPLLDAAGTTGWGWLVILVAVAAVLAATGSLLTMILGVSRTGLAMARDGHLPRVLARVNPTHQVPRLMEISVAVAVCIVILVGDIVTAIGFSSFGVLLYYSVANLSALRMTPEQSRPSPIVPIVGLLGCLALAFSVPWQSLLSGVAVLAAGTLAYFISGGDRRNNSESGTIV